MGSLTCMSLPITETTQYSPRTIRLPTWKRTTNFHLNKICNQQNIPRRILMPSDRVKNAKSVTAMLSALNTNFANPLKDTELDAKTVCAQTVSIRSTANNLAFQQNADKYAIVSAIQLCLTQKIKLKMHQLPFQLKSSRRKIYSLVT